MFICTFSEVTKSLISGYCLHRWYSFPSICSSDSNRDSDLKQPLFHFSLLAKLYFLYALVVLIVCKFFHYQPMSRGGFRI